MDYIFDDVRILIDGILGLREEGGDRGEKKSSAEKSRTEE